MANAASIPAVSVPTRPSVRNRAKCATGASASVARAATSTSGPSAARTAPATSRNVIWRGDSVSKTELILPLPMTAFVSNARPSTGAVRPLTTGATVPVVAHHVQPSTNQSALGIKSPSKMRAWHDATG